MPNHNSAHIDGPTRTSSEESEQTQEIWVMEHIRLTTRRNGGTSRFFNWIQCTASFVFPVNTCTLNALLIWTRAFGLLLLYSTAGPQHWNFFIFSFAFVFEFKNILFGFRKNDSGFCRKSSSSSEAKKFKRNYSFDTYHMISVDCLRVFQNNPCQCVFVGKRDVNVDDIANRKAAAQSHSHTPHVKFDEKLEQQTKIKLCKRALDWRETTKIIHKMRT